MSRVVALAPTAPSVHVPHARFLTILPRIELHGRICCRFLAPGRIRRLNKPSSSVTIVWEDSQLVKGSDPRF
jgi:hypothetical protein